MKSSLGFRIVSILILTAFLSQSAGAQVTFNQPTFEEIQEGTKSEEIEGEIIVPPDYRLGPGDVVRIMLRGEISGDWSVPIDYNGNMSLPRAEAIRVLGLTFAQLQAALHQVYSKYFKNFELRVAMEELRSAALPPIPEEELPSPEELKALSDAELDRLFLSAPPSEVVKKLPRFGYDFFQRPISTFAPVEGAPVGPNYIVGPGDQVKIFLWGMIEGEWSAVVSRDGSLNLPRAGTINAAGLTFAQLQEAIRKAYSRYYTNFEINVTMGRLRSITVYIAGSAKRPGAYTVSSLATIVNALIAAGGPDVSGSMRDIQLKRSGKTIVHFDMYDLLLKGDTSKDLRLMPGDVIFIPPAGATAGAVGSVKRPGLYELKERIRLGEFIEMAGGMTGQSFKGRVQIMRVEGRRYQTLIEGDMDALGQDFLQKFAVQDGDIVRIFPVERITTTMRVVGPVASPGEYAVEPGITRVSDVINRAGGLLYMASNQAELTRIKVTQVGPITERILINLEKALQNDPKHDIPLEMNDYLFVRTVPEWALYRTVTLTGEVKHPGTYTVRKGDTLSSLIERAGGYTDKAYLKGAIFLRESVRVEQQKSIDEMVNRLERELYSVSTTATATSFTAEEAQIVEREAQQKQRLLDVLRQTRATGRVVVRLEDPPELLKRTPFDIELEEGDRLHIPKKPQTVQVVGSVMNESAFVFEPYRRHNYYIQKAGGYGVNADRKRIYLLKADGSAIKVGSLKKPPYLEEGDTIVVPEKIQVTSTMRDTAHIIDMVYKVAISAAVVVDALDDD